MDRLGKPEGKEETHKYVSMKYPEYLPCMRLVKSEDVRKKLDLARGTQCIWPNEGYLEELAEKRHEYAQCLGYASYSDFILEIRMAKKAINVQNFEEDLTKTILAKGREEFEVLQKLKRDETGDPNA
jgi:Zn-dependent oligopeptidase